MQTGHPAGQPFCSWQSYGAVTADAALYRNLRENIPILDAAIGKLVRLTGGFSLDTGNDGLNAQLNRALSGINVGGNQQGIEAFIATYLDQLLTYGSAVGEMITDGRELYALYNGDTRNLEVRRAGNGLDLCFFSGGEPLPGAWRHLVHARSAAGRRMVKRAPDGASSRSCTSISPRWPSTIARLIASPSPECRPKCSCSGRTE